MFVSTAETVAASDSLSKIDPLAALDTLPEIVGLPALDTLPEVALVGPDTAPEVAPTLPTTDLEESRSTSPPESSRGWGSRATLMLIVVALLWGVSAPLMKDWQTAAIGCPGGEFLASVTLIALRMSAALGVLIAVRPGLVSRARARDHGIGLLIGSSFAVGITFQVLGLAWTTPARSAFIMSLGSAWIPLLAWACLGLSVTRASLIGLTLGILGAAVISVGDSEGTLAGPALNRGDALTLAASIILAVQILLLDRLGRKTEPSHLSVGFFAMGAGASAAVAIVAALSSAGLGAWLDWTVAMLSNPKVLIELMILILFPTVLAVHLMNIYQPRVSANRVALIYLLEPVFSAAFSVPWGHDELGLALVAGGVLILGGNVLVELPIWRPRSRQVTAGELAT
jgi:drug/metabolite transporter (DMT)-like permease